MEECLRRRWGHSAFRPGQKSAIQAVMRGVDVIASMASSSGKSLASHFPAVFLSEQSGTSAFSLIISPIEQVLIQHNQCFRSLGITSVYLSSSPLRSEMLDSSVNFVLIRPEILPHSRDYLLNLMNMSKFVSVVIEDARLVESSDNLTLIREWFADIPIMVLLDLRNPTLITNITDTLKLRSPLIVRTSLNRPNVYISAMHLTLASLLEYVTNFYDECAADSECSDISLKPSTLLVIGTPFAENTISSAISSHEPLKVLHVESAVYNKVMFRTIDRFNRDQIQILLISEDLIHEVIKPDIRLLIYFGTFSSLENVSPLFAKTGGDGVPSTLLISHETSSSNLAFDPVNYLCSSHILCRRSYLLRYLETGYTVPEVEDVIPFQSCCDSCDSRIVGLSKTEQNMKKESDVSVPKVPSQADTERLEKSLREVRSHLCQKYGEMAPYKILTTEEIRYISLQRPTSVNELISRFQWTEERISIIGKAIVSCVTADNLAHNISKSTEKLECLSPVDIEKEMKGFWLPKKRSSVVLSTDDLRSPSPPAPLSTVGRSAPVAKPLPALPPAATIKRRKSEAVNSSSGIVRRTKPCGPRLKRAASLPTETIVHDVIASSSTHPPASRDWETEILNLLISGGSKTFLEILQHFGPFNDATRGDVAHAIRQALQGLGEKCCLYIEGGKYYWIAPPHMG